MKPINVGLLGIGTVGGGTLTVLARNREEIQRRAGREIRIAAVGDKDIERARKLAATPRASPPTPSRSSTIPRSTSSSN